MDRRGFTIVELIITISIMAILLTLGTVSLSSSQANARDSERKTDIENIALHIETYYTSGFDGSYEVGRYPSTNFIGQETTTAIPDIDPKSLIAPGQSTSSFIAATNNTQTTEGISPQPTINQYVYQPLQQSGNLCTTGSQQCQKFNLYYRLEVDNTIYMVTSKNQ